MPSQPLKIKTPFETLFSKKPDYNCLNIFGCRGYPYLKTQTTNKFAKKTYPCVFVGYSTTHKGYRCLDPLTNRIYISQHVIFDEFTMPFDNKTTHTTQTIRI